MIDRLDDWSIGWLIDCLIGEQMIDRLCDRSIDWLIDWLFLWSIDWLIDRLIDLSIVWSVDWLMVCRLFNQSIGWLFDRLIDWSTVWSSVDSANVINLSKLFDCRDATFFWVFFHWLKELIICVRDVCCSNIIRSGCVCLICIRWANYGWTRNYSQ
jgi:hypothetical protein